MRTGAREKQEFVEDRTRGEDRDTQDRDPALPDAASSGRSSHAQRQLQCHGHLQGKHFNFAFFWAPRVPKNKNKRLIAFNLHFIAY